LDKLDPSLFLEMLVTDVQDMFWSSWLSKILLFPTRNWLTSTFRQLTSQGFLKRQSRVAWERSCIALWPCHLSSW